MENKKSALITGASGGIGAAIVTALAKKGFAVIAICADKDKDGLSKVKATVEKEFPETQIFSYLGDVSDEAFVEEMSRDFLESAGRIDVLVNNAGISYYGLIQDMTYSEWKRVIDVNLSSVFLTSKYFVPSMIRNGGGRMINISSMWGRTGASTEAAYSASKGGVEAFTKALSKELAPSGIAVNAVSPGVVDTRMNQHLSLSEKEALKEMIPAGRFAAAEEIADTVAYLSDAPLYLTGQVIGIDGGFI